jgi:pilus assembly protein CpaC
MTMNVHFRFAAACAVLASCMAHAMAAPRAITMEQGQQKTWTETHTISRVATGNSDIVGVNVAPPRGVILTAGKPGTTMISVWQQGGTGNPSTQFQVVVTPAGMSARPVSAAESREVQASIDGPRLRLSGGLSSLERHGYVNALGTEADGKPSPNVVDATTSNFDVQVQIDVKIVEVSRQKLKEAGLYYQRFNGTGSTGIGSPNSYGGLTSDGQDLKFILPSGGVPFVDAFNIFRVSRNTWAAFSALESNGFAYSLAEPSLTALSGQTATFLAGGEIPIPYRTGLDGAVSVQFKEFGIRLALTPTVLDEQRITVRVAPEVSEVDPSLSVQSGGFTIPGLRVRRTETTVAIGNGETFVISGLVSRETTASVAKFPFLADIPILGAFFRSTRFDREDKELLMIATPHLVRAFAKTSKLPPLPGQEVRDYDPAFGHLFLKEKGTFTTDGGFSD